jgi:uncharacterized membrane protein
MEAYFIVLSILGFANAAYLYRQYRTHVATGAPMVCVFGKNCGDVVASKYGRTFGVKNELWGMAFYLSLVVYFFSPTIRTLLPSSTILFVAASAAMFSTYLLFLQMVVLKKFCSWCLAAIAINYAIFLLTFV